MKDARGVLLTERQEEFVRREWMEHLNIWIGEELEKEYRPTLEAERAVRETLRRQLKRTVKKVILYPNMTVDQLGLLAHTLKQQGKAGYDVPRWFNPDKRRRWQGQARPDGGRVWETPEPPEPSEDFIELCLTEWHRDLTQEKRKQVRKRLKSR